MESTKRLDENTITVTNAAMLAILVFLSGCVVGSLVCGWIVHRWAAW